MAKGRGVTNRSRIPREKLVKFLAQYRQGASIEGCCAYAGINKATFYKFIKDAEPDPETKKPIDEEAADFKFQMDMEGGKFEGAVLDELWKQFRKGRWQIGAWLLERRLPGQYNKTEMKKAPKKQTQSKVKFENIEIDDGETVDEEDNDGDESDPIEGS